MFKQILITACSAAFAAGIMAPRQSGPAPQSGVTITIPAGKTSAVNGAQMYFSYCAPCHGVDGRGHGPVAVALKTPPPDLTMLSRNNNGKYPGAHIVAVLEFGASHPSHGSAQMPIWGPILKNMNSASPTIKVQRISNLSRYLETLQTK